MNPDKLSCYQLRNIIAAAKEDERDLSIILFALPSVGKMLERNRIKAKIANRKAIIKKAQDLIAAKTTAAVENHNAHKVDLWPSNDL